MFHTVYTVQTWKMNGIKADGLWPKYHMTFSMQIETHICRILPSYINPTRNNFWRLLQAHTIFIPVYGFLIYFISALLFSSTGVPLFAASSFALWVIFQFNFFNIRISAHLWNMFFPIQPHSTISPPRAILLAFCCFVSLIFSLLGYKPHLLIMLPPPLPTLILTPTQMPALLLPDTYTQKLLLPHFIPNPQRDPLKCAVILRDIYVCRSSLRHLVFYLQRYSAIFLLSLAVKNSLSSFHVPYVLSGLLFLLWLAWMFPFSVLICPDV